VYRREAAAAPTERQRRPAPLREVATLGADDTLTSPLLPGFAVRVARLFGRE
jgi:hypothetical protein